MAILSLLVIAAIVGGLVLLAILGVAGFLIIRSSASKDNSEY